MKYRFHTVAGLALVGSLTGILIAASGWTPAFAPPAARADAYTVEKAYLSLGGGAPELLASCEGGGAYADVIQESMGPSGLVKKHVGAAKYEDLVVELTPGANQPVMDWVVKSWSANPERKDVKANWVSASGSPAGECEYLQSLVVDTTFPACDASSRDRGTIVVKIAPESVREAKGKGTAPKTAETKSAGKAWIPANFALEINGLDCSKVVKIEAFSVKRQAIADNITGNTREGVHEQGKVEFPDLKITLTASTAQTWKAWFDSFVVKGENNDDKEKSGSLTLLAADRKTPILKFNFHNLGIRRLADLPRESGSESARTVRAELYCERIDIE